VIDREAIYAALWALASAAANFATTSRRVRHWADVTPAEQPCLIMEELRETGEIKALGAPTVWKLSADLGIYVHSSDPYVSPSTKLNPLIDAVEAALAPSPVTGILNLGMPGVVQHAYIAGEIQKTPGVDGDQAVAIIPVEILCIG
jgi:hypothetical protein